MRRWLSYISNKVHLSPRKMDSFSCQRQQAKRKIRSVVIQSVKALEVSYIIALLYIYKCSTTLFGYTPDDKMILSSGGVLAANVTLCESIAAPNMPTLKVKGCQSA